MTKRQLHQKDQIITPLIEQGQSPYQILTNHPELEMSVRSMYTYIDKGMFTARNIDLKRQPKFKPRKCHKPKSKTVPCLLTEPMLIFVLLTSRPILFVEMDTVKSSRDSQRTLLTMIFTEENYFLHLLNRCTKGAVRAVFDRLEKRMGTFEFISVFENILTDRGSEFSDPNALETGINGIERTNIYYCDPMRSGQKELLSRLIRCLEWFLPKRNFF